MGHNHLKSVSIGIAAGAATAASIMVGRKVLTTAKMSQGHPLKHRLLDISSNLLQPKYPLDAMSTYLNGFHFYADDMGRQVEATHFCILLRHDLHQCVIFDSNAPDARLIGIEYIISEQRFQSLPEEEEHLWHSHHYEVKSGALVAPGVPELAEHAYFEDLVTTYGKTFHTWQYDRDDFPYGIPQLMMGFTADGQLREDLIQDRDDKLGISTSDKRDNRADIPNPSVQPGANAWEGGQTAQTDLRQMETPWEFYPQQSSALGSRIGHRN
ncbi:MAG: OBAP family protein [Yaniella sp.]|uniref:OBAP family protein n=1 Tax=Yaniella sp. TaxID=2773929 RepID=UPI0026497ACC|nr:OBAP family protein [Yaniella sp.]MDN5704333.1 OBAP family protein [Yaniella sp.]MDN5732265.1 OBAP family protein [Yaniella sp.]MDN5742708.1 OBAP family protein [Yaniella sp.]MDN5815755.1 OBAP family protein [Yaniella sp.]MDN5819030.1 OBAP family protein [Yaniella sp.]